MKFKSVQAKTLFFILPVVFLIIIAIVTVSFLYARSSIVAQTQYGMDQQLGKINNAIQNRLTANSKLPETYGKTVGDQVQDLTMEQYRSIAKRNLESNPDTFALGVFFVPYAYEAKSKYVGVYAYREDGKITTTEQYSEPSYDYLNQHWYTIAVDQKEPVFSDPYYDPGLDLSMLTTAVPVYTKDNKFIGVATGDIILSTIQDMVKEAKVGKTGYAFLIDKNGTYLAGPDQDKIMKAKLQEDKDPALAEVGKTLLEKKTGNLVHKTKTGDVSMFYQEVPGAQWILATAIPNKELMAPVNSITTKLILIGIAGIVLIVGLIFLYSRNITQHIGRINLMSGHLSKGDFTHTIPVTTRDEFGQMAGNFNDTAVLLREMLAQVSEHAKQVADTSEQLSANAGQTSKVVETIAETVQDMAAGAETQVRGAEESARAMEELAIGIQRIAESSSAVSETTLKTADKTMQGNEIIQNAVRDMDHANKTVSETAALIGKLNESSEQIGKIIAVISGISTQTNLLALNANIEAARAGEHGRGFAVVAGEIRKLAEQTSQSADQIRALIEETQRFTSEAVRSMELGTAAVGRGTEHVRNAGEAFDAILADIRSVVDQFHDVTASSEEMSASSQQVTATVEELSRIAVDTSGYTQKVSGASEEQLAAMEEISASAASLSVMMQELQELTAKFKV
jgi:methyl-accepting chemotaxis protein